MKLSPMEEVTGSNLLFPVGVRPAMDIMADDLPRLPSTKWGSDRGFPVRYYLGKKSRCKLKCMQSIISFSFIYCLNELFIAMQPNFIYCFSE
jgi:hypothetical protein